MTPSGVPPLLAVDGLHVSFSQGRRRVSVLEDVDFTVRAGEIVGLVGESGSGKTVTALSVMRLLGGQATIEGGRILFEDRDLLALDEPDMRTLRGRELAMVFQEPMTSLNPLLPVGFQIAEVLVEHFRERAGAAQARAVELMTLVGIPDAAARSRDHPHQLSGGMRQRVMIAMAMACRPKLLIADEPTTALDVTIQAQILDLMRDLCARFNTAILLITHDLGVVAQMADRVIVMYAGHIVEEAEVAKLFRAPLHPYTRLLLKAIPRAHRKREALFTIPGTIPSPGDLPPGCRFLPRCPDALDECLRTPALEVHGRARVRCWRTNEIGLRSAEAE